MLVLVSTIEKCGAEERRCRKKIVKWSEATQHENVVRDIYLQADKFSLLWHCTIRILIMFCVCDFILFISHCDFCTELWCHAWNHVEIYAKWMRPRKNINNEIEIEVRSLKIISKIANLKSIRITSKIIFEIN